MHAKLAQVRVGQLPERPVVSGPRPGQRRLRHQPASRGPIPKAYGPRPRRKVIGYPPPGAVSSTNNEQ